MNSIIKIQSWFRGDIIRRKIRPNFLYSEIIGKKLTDELIEFFIVKKIIPEVILDVISTNKIYNYFGINSQTEQISFQIYHSIISTIVPQLIRPIVSDSLNSLISRYNLVEFFIKKIKIIL